MTMHTIILYDNFKNSIIIIIMIKLNVYIIQCIIIIIIYNYVCISHPILIFQANACYRHACDSMGTVQINTVLR